MAQYIEREALLDSICHDTCRIAFCGATNCDFRAKVCSAPAADVALVVHARWEWFDEETGTPSTGYEREWGWRCSHCGEELSDDYDDPDDSPTFRFCYNCGAKMDRGDSDEAD